ASVAPALHATGRGMGPYDPADPPEHYRELAQRAASVLGEHGVTAESISGLGDAGEAIVSAAAEHDADLIVVGMSHHPHLSRFLGGVSEDVAHHGHCDVLLVH